MPFEIPISYHQPMNLPIDPAVLILGIALVVVLYFYYREFTLREKIEREGQEFLESIKEKGWETLHQSIEKSQDIIGEAELEGVKINAAFNQKLEEIMKMGQTSVTNSYNQLIGYLDSLQKVANTSQQTSEKIAQQRVNQLFDNLEQRLSDFLVETSQKTSSSIELELKAARSLIDTYKQEQLKLIDENILAMMEQTLSIVLNKKLSLQDHLDLVYEALERAKVEKFIA